MVISDKTMIISLFAKVFLQWVIKYFYSHYLTPTIVSGGKKFFNRVSSLILTRGRVDACRQVKLARLAVTRHLSGHPILERPYGIKLTKAGLPRLLPSSLRDLATSGDPRGISLLLSFLTVTRGILGGTPVDTESITKPFKGECRFLYKHLDKFIDTFGINKFDPTWSQFHWTTKFGPGGPALLAALMELRRLPESLKDDLKLLGGIAFADLLATFEGWPDWI